MSATCRRHVGDMSATQSNVNSLAPTHHFWPTQFQDVDAQLCRWMPTCQFPAKIERDWTRLDNMPHTTHTTLKPWIVPSCMLLVVFMVMGTIMMSNYYVVLQDNKLSNYLHLYALNVESSAILIELGPGEFWLWHTSSQHQTLPSHISINIGPLPSIFA